MRTSSIVAAVVALAPFSVFAAPTRKSWLDLVTRKIDPAVYTNSVCDISTIQVPLGNVNLPKPSEGMYVAHVAVGRGTQNYTCDPTNPTAAPKAAGALAELFNVTCMAASPQNVVAEIPTHALKYAIPNTADVNTAAGKLFSGMHYFTNLTTPFFDFKQGTHDYGNVHTVKQSAADAPETATKGADGLVAVPWLKLAGFQGDYREVYRVDTAGGSAPKTCQGQPDKFQVDYSATYYFLKLKE